MSLKESDSVLSLFYFRIPRKTHPNIIYEEPDDEASSSDKDVSDAGKNHFFYCSFFAVRRDKREMLSISQKQIPPPHAPTVRLPRNRKEGPGARASWVGV